MDKPVTLELIIKAQQETIDAQKEIIRLLGGKLKLFGCDLMSPPPKEISHEMFLRQSEDRING